MPISTYDLAQGTFVQACAKCGATRTLRLDSLVLGVAPAPGVVGVNVIQLPECAANGCGAGEWLMRSWDAMPAEGLGSVTDKQRRAVNAIARALKDAGRSRPEAKAQHDAENTTPPDVGASTGEGLLVRTVVAQKPADSAPAAGGPTPEYVAIKEREDEAPDESAAPSPPAPSP